MPARKKSVEETNSPIKSTVKKENNVETIVLELKRPKIESTENSAYSTYLQEQFKRHVRLELDKLAQRKAKEYFKANSGELEKIVMECVTDPKFLADLSKRIMSRIHINVY